jgi:hypothetical protein
MEELIRAVFKRGDRPSELPNPFPRLSVRRGDAIVTGRTSLICASISNSSKSPTCFKDVSFKVFAGGRE